MGQGGKNLPQLKNPLYLNANLIFSEVWNVVNKPGWKCQLNVGTLGKLRAEGYQLTTSILTRFEVIQKIRMEKRLPPHKVREAYSRVIDGHEIVELDVQQQVSLTPAFLDDLARTNLALADGIHLTFAKKADMKVCTHDKKAKSAQHDDKKKFYDKVYKPQELISPKKPST